MGFVEADNNRKPAMVGIVIARKVYCNPKLKNSYKWKEKS